MAHSVFNDSLFVTAMGRSNESRSAITKNIGEEDIDLNLSTASISIVACFLCVVIVLTVLGNSAALIAFSIYRPLRTVTNYFLINLCISDITVATICMPFWISYILTGWPSALNGGVYEFWMCLDIFCGTWSIMSLAMISIERYTCVGFPLYYQSLVTKRRTLIMVAFVLFYSTISSLLGYAQFVSQTPKLSISIFTLSFVVPVIIKSYTYGKIYKEAKKQQKFINQEEKDRIRLLAQKHLFAAGRNLDEKPASIQDSKMQCELKASSHEVTTKQVENISAVIQQPDKISIDSEVQKTENCRIRVLTCYSPSQHKVNSTIAYVSQDRIIPKGKLNCCCRRKGVDNQSPTSKPMSSGDTDITYEYSGLQLGEKCCSESVDDLRKLGIDDWNAYLDELEGPQAAVVEEATESQENSKSPSKEKVYGDYQSKACDSSGSKKVILPTDSCNPSMLGQDTNPSSELTKSQQTTFVDPLPKLKSKQQSSRFLRARSVKFFKSESIIEMKQQGLCRFKRLQREVKASKVIGRIIGTFLLLWTPFMVVVVMTSLDINVSMKTVITTKCLHYANSAINPILYVVFNKNFKKALSRLLRMMC